MPWAADDITGSRAGAHETGLLRAGRRSDPPPASAPPQRVLLLRLSSRAAVRIRSLRLRSTSGEAASRGAPRTPRARCGGRLPAATSRTRRSGGACVYRPRARASCCLFIVDRPSTLRFFASSYSWSLVGPRALLWERCPPRWEADSGSRSDARLAVFDSPARARSLLTVRAAISSARRGDSPRLRADSLTCSYCRSLLALEPRGVSAPPHSFMTGAAPPPPTQHGPDRCAGRHRRGPGRPRTATPTGNRPVVSRASGPAERGPGNEAV